MHRTLKKNVFSSVLTLIGLMTFSLVLALPSSYSNNYSHGASEEPLNIALYPYVPRPDQFQRVLSNAWNKLHPNVALNYVSWDCYSVDPPDNLDVFVFDGIFLDYFVTKGYLASFAPRDIEGFDDFLDYAVRDSKVNNTYYGIPQLGCGNLLFYRDGDKALAQAKTLDQVSHAIGRCTDSSIPPPQGKNLLVDLSGGTTDSCLYLETEQDVTNRYTPDPPLPPADHLDNRAVSNLQSLVIQGCKEQVGYSSTNQYQRAAWFGAGLGRAAIGFTESMSAMGDARKTVDFKLMPLANQTEVHLFYIDLTGINSKVADPTRKSLALALANLVSSSNVLVASFGPTEEYNYPQYLMPVRKSVFAALRQNDPIYQRMFDLVSKSNPHMFRIGPNSRQWLSANKSAIRQKILSVSLAKAKTAH
jgi:thiamine pyridinylase